MDGSYMRRMREALKSFYRGLNIRGNSRFRSNPISSHDDVTELLKIIGSWFQKSSFPFPDMDTIFFNPFPHFLRQYFPINLITNFLIGRFHMIFRKLFVHLHTYHWLPIFFLVITNKGDWMVLE